MAAPEHTMHGSARHEPANHYYTRIIVERGDYFQSNSNSNVMNMY